MSFDYYHLRDACEFTCATCALSDLKDMLEQEGAKPGRPAGRLRAMIKWSEPADVDALFRTADIGCQSWTYVGNNLNRNRAARDLLYDLVDRFHADGTESRYGENCGGCNATLIEEFVSCHHCGYGEYGPDFDYADFGRSEEWRMDGDDGPLVRFCDQCEDDWLPGNVEEITTDRRGYNLIFIEHYTGKLTNGGRTDRPIYAAGCRRFTLEQALAHWGNPKHFDQPAALELFNGVLRHAMERALPNLNVGA